jgi:hypothetical protein
VAEGAFPLFDSRLREPRLTSLSRNALVEIRIVD